MEIRQLKAFIAIAETKTFTAGAKRMNVTQAAISMQIRQLEQEVGVPLFVRTPRKAVLTEAGEHLIGRARNILREHDAAVAEIAELAGSEHGRLRIGSASAAFSIEQLPVILEKLKKKFSNAEISVSSGTSQALVEKIIHGEIDVAFVSLPVEAANIHTELLFSDEILAIAHPSHRLAVESVVSAADLAREPLILGEKGGNTRRMIDEFFQQSNVKPRVVMELSRQSAINRMVENGLGVGIAGAKGIAKAVGEKRLVSWMIEGSEIRWELGLAWIRGGYRSPIEKEFTLLCQSIFKNK